MTASLFVQMLLLATALSGALRMWDHWIWRPARKQEDGTYKAWPTWLDNTAGMFYYLLALLVLRCFVVEIYEVPTGSLLPTVQLKDRILVDKFSYGLRNPLTNEVLIPTGQPNRGDIVVFQYPVDPQEMYVKRVIGLPGDIVLYENKTLTVNGKAPFRYATHFSEKAQTQGMVEKTEWLITQAGLVRPHRIWVQPDLEIDYQRQPAYRANPYCDHQGQRITCKIPPGHYFMMGDNRDNSSDSRVWGLVSEQQIVGKAHRVLFNTEQWGRAGHPLEALEP